MTAELPRLSGADELRTDGLRADAQDNRDRILEAARELLARQGLGVGMREIARHAEVGPATVYRRFPTKQALVDAAFAAELVTCRRIVEEGCADQDAWHGFVAVIERLTALNVRNQGFVDAFMSTDPAATAFAEHRRDLLQLLGDLAERAQRQGGLRRDFVIDDLVLVLLADVVCRQSRRRAGRRRPTASRRWRSTRCEPSEPGALARARARARQRGRVSA